LSGYLVPRPQTSLQSGTKSEEYLHTHWDCQAEVCNIYVLSCNSEESKRLIFKLKNKGDLPGGPRVRNLPSQCKGHRFHPWLRNYDPMCCGATKPVRHKEWSQRTQQRACLLPLRPSATTLNRKLRNKEQKSNGVMQMPFQNKQEARRRCHSVNCVQEDSGNAGLPDPLLCSPVFTAVLHLASLEV